MIRADFLKLIGSQPAATDYIPVAMLLKKPCKLIKPIVKNCLITGVSLLASYARIRRGKNLLSSATVIRNTRK